MPVYDYVCGACRHRFEVFHGLNESGPHLCPLCGGRVSRAFAPPTIHFKGTGWAKLDRRASGAPRRKAAETGAEPDGGAPKRKDAETGAEPDGGTTGGGPAEGAAGSGSTRGPEAAD